MVNFKERFISGLIPSPPDERDYKISRIANKEVTFAKEFCRWIPPTKDQGNINSCVPHSGATIKEDIEKIQSNTQQEFAVGFNYGYRFYNHFKGQGMYPREYLDVLLKIGIPLKNDFPFNEEFPQVLLKINPVENEIKEKAYPYRISAYARLNNEEDIKTALTKVSSVLYAIPVYDELFNPNNKGIVNAPSNINNAINGYHAVVLHGWTVIDNKEYWIIQNSWGTSYGLNGIIFLDKNYPFEEAWSITDNILPDIEDKSGIRLQINNYTYTIDGVEYQMDTVPFIKDDRTFVPVRFIAEALNCKVTWDDKSQAVIIKNKY